MEKDELEKLFLERLEPSDDNVQEHQFSEKYRNRKARIIGRHRVKLSARRIIIPAAAVCAVAMMIAAVNIFRAPGFWGYDHSDNLELFVEDRQNGPQTLEELYKVEVPDGFEITMFSDPFGRSLDVRYSQTDGSDEIMFTQTVRSSYNTHYDNEHWEIEQCTIAGYPGIMFKGDNNNIVWDNGEYIMELYGSLTVDQRMEIAETAAPCDRALRRDSRRCIRRTHATLKRYRSEICPAGSCSTGMKMMWRCIQLFWSAGVIFWRCPRRHGMRRTARASMMSVPR